MRPVILIAVLAVVAVAAVVALRYGAARARRRRGVDGRALRQRRDGHGRQRRRRRLGADGRARASSPASRSAIRGGYDTDYAVRIGSATVALDIGSLAGDVPVVEELILDGALINAEQREAASNLTDIQKHATASSGEPQAGEPGRIVVERFRVRNARVLVTSEHLSRPEELPLRDIVVKSIGSATGGATYSEAAEAMLMPVLAAARAAAAERLRSAAGRGRLRRRARGARRGVRRAPRAGRRGAARSSARRSRSC